MPAKDRNESTASGTVTMEEVQGYNTYQRDVMRPIQPSDSFEYGSIRATPEHSLIAHEPQSLSKPGHIVTTKSRHSVRVVQDEEGSLLFESPKRLPRVRLRRLLSVHRDKLTPTAPCPTTFNRVHGLGPGSLSEEASQCGDTHHCRRPTEHH